MKPDIEATAARVAMMVCMVFALILLASCASPDPQIVRISKGEASALGKLFGANARYCQITTTKGVSITEKDREAAREYCAPDDQRLLELLRREGL